MDIDQYMAQAQALLLAAFPGRLVCLGLQGSFARGEAGPDSDIDLVVILDRVDLEDILTYRRVLDRLPARERSCGFFSGKGELMAWDRGELFQFYHDTRPCFGDLEFLRPLLDRRAVERALHAGACAIYHGCVHNLLHGQSPAALGALYKQAFFLLQAKCWLEREIYCPSARELLEHLAGADRRVLERREALRLGGEISQRDLLPYSEPLLEWARRGMAERGGEGALPTDGIREEGIG